MCNKQFGATVRFRRHRNEGGRYESNFHALSLGVLSVKLVSLFAWRGKLFHEMQIGELEKPYFSAFLPHACGRRRQHRSPPQCVCNNIALRHKFKGFVRATTSSIVMAVLGSIHATSRGK